MARRLPWLHAARGNRAKGVLSDQGEHTGKIRIVLHGAFHVESSAGVDLTPGGAKARGLLAMLAVAPGYRRGRAWLGGRLWSDRGSKQAQGSLRQALVEIRKALGPYAFILCTDRSTIWLQPKLVEIAPALEPVPEPGSFLDGIHVHDPEFTAWLATMRRAQPTLSAPSPASARLSRQQRSAVLIDFVRAAPHHAFFETLLVDAAARSIGEAIDIDIIRGFPTTDGARSFAPGTLLVQMQIAELEGGGIGLRASIEDIASMAIFWTEYQKLNWDRSSARPGLDAYAFIHRMTRAIEHVLSTRSAPDISHAGYDAAVLAASAFRKMFRMQHAELSAAQDLLDTAIEVAPRGLYHAWRAQLSVIRYVERHHPDLGGLRAACEADVAQALELEPLNSNVLSGAANARLVFENDVDAARMLADQAVKVNSGNPLAWWSLSNAQLYGGNTSLAYETAVTAQTLAEGSSLKSWTDFQRALTAAVNGRLEEASTFAMSSHVFAPSFRPPLRYLIAINSKLENLARCTYALRRLEALETDFTVRRLVDDKTYPASLIRKYESILMSRDFLSSYLDVAESAKAAR